MKRTIIKDIHTCTDKEITLAGWIDVRRDHGKLIFIDVRDRSGIVQVVVSPKHEHAYKVLKEARSEWVVEITGTVKKRPESMINPNTETGDVEVEAQEVIVLSEAHELPFEKEEDLNLDTYLDHLPFTLRSRRSRDIFTVQTELIKSFREGMSEQDFIEYQNPILVGGDGEGGAEAFKVEYYNNKEALLATSPQLYKQIMVGVYERVFTTTKVFRAEKHATSRHLSEVVQMDFEMGFINDHEDVMAVLEETMRYIVSNVSKKHKDILDTFKVAIPLIPKSIPRLTLLEAQKTLKEKYSNDCIDEPDLEPEHERQICEWALKEHKSDFVFITHFPSNKRPFYTFVDEKDETLSKSFDLLFRGLEINSGGQRVHNYEELLRRIEEKGLDPQVFSFYLEAFKYGMPPHGGCSTGLERLTARFLELSNVKEATLFPREINRIDLLLSQ